MKTTILALVFSSLCAMNCGQNNEKSTSESSTSIVAQSDDQKKPGNMSDKVSKTNEEWKKELSAEEYRVLREQGTERAYSGKYWDNHETGTYVCAACGKELFTSFTKFDSGTGWPSFYEPMNAQSVEESKDEEYGMTRTEVHCARCGGHLGHVFDDGPKPTSLRYCINSVSIELKEK